MSKAASSKGAGGAGRAAGDVALTVEQFATEAGLSVRTVRSYQQRRLLEPPVIRSGIGYYGNEHLGRMRRIVELQAQGLSLSEIERQLNDRRPSVEQIVDLTRVITEPFETATPEIVTRDQLISRCGPFEEQDIARAQDLGLLLAVGDGTFEAPSPSLLRAVEEVAALGVAAATALDVLETVTRNCEATSKTFVELFVDHVWRPFDEAGAPPDRWQGVTEAIEQLRALASEVVLAVFSQTMEAEIERTFGEIVEEQATRAAQGRSGTGE